MAGARNPLTGTGIRHYDDRIMSHSGNRSNRVKHSRAARGWSQDELARLVGISRTEVSAIETERVVPSVATALALATALGAPVEELFGGRSTKYVEPAWAWAARTGQTRFWQAEVGGRTLRYPAEETGAGVISHDGRIQNGRAVLSSERPPERTLVMACCDPAAGILAAELARTGEWRLLVLPRSSSQALELLGAGLVHLAGIHLSKSSRRNDNAEAVREKLGAGYSLLHLARWTEGIAVSPGERAESIDRLLRSKLRWVGREAGSGARQCLDDLLEGRPAPKRVARDHRGVAEAIRSGWADAGVCLKLVSDEAGLQFLSVRDEAYDVCFRTDFVGDPRMRALHEVVRSPSYRQTLGELPGYDAAHTGEVRRVE